MQLVRPPAQQAATAGTEQGVAAEQHAMPMVGHMCFGMPGHGKHLQAQRIIEQYGLCPIGCRFGDDARDARVRRTDHPQRRKACQQLCNTADMIRMVMRE